MRNDGVRNQQNAFGNEFNVGEPTNELDKIAQEHDIEYTEIQQEYKAGI